MFPNWITQRAKLTPQRTALTFENQSWTFQELYEISLKRAYQLAHIGIKKKSRVAVLGANTPQLIFIMYGCMHLQCEMVLLNRKLTKNELAYQIQDAEVSLVIVDDEDMDKIPEEITYITFSTVQNSEEKVVDIENEWLHNQTVSIMYTSGTTGYPKGVRQTVENHQTSALSSVLNIGLSNTDVWLCAVPIFHISGFSILVRSLLYGNEVKLYERFDEEKAVFDIISGNVTHMSVVAVMLERILQKLESFNQKASPKFKVMLTGGGPVPKAYIERAQKVGLPLCQTYGMTETSSQTATLSNEDALRKVGSVGKPLFFYNVKILNSSKPYEEGEILIRGAHVTPGYVGRFKHKSPTIDGWLHTGDIGYFDEEGYLYVIDRRSDLIISGGENIYPAEVENVLLSHPKIVEAGVCGVEDHTWGQVPIAFIVKKESITEEEILDYCLQKLAKYKVPKAIYFVEQLPRNASNKLMRRKLKDYLKNE